MRISWLGRLVMFGVVFGVFLSSMAGGMAAEDVRERLVQVCARDEQGNAVADAAVQVEGGSGQRGTTDQSGCVSVHAASHVTVSVSKSGYGTATQTVGDGNQLTVVLRVSGGSVSVEGMRARTDFRF